MFVEKTLRKREKYMSIRERKSKKHGITYQVYFNYIDIYTNEITTKLL